jgi:hypothetical protein
MCVPRLPAIITWFNYSLLQLPQNPDEWKAVAEEFYTRSDFPNCCGAIDGKHVQIQKPTGSGATFFNYKKTFSIVLLALVNARYELLMVDCGINGRISDGGVLFHSDFGRALYAGKLKLPKPTNLPESTRTAPYVFVSDDAFALHTNMIKPYPYTSMKREETIYNGWLSRARNVVEDTFGILTSRFEIFQQKFE